MKISITSGKGGTGKTFLSTNLALAISNRKLSNRELLFIDCDVEEPNAHFFLKPKIHKSEIVYQKVPKIDKSKCTGCGVCSNFCRFNTLATTKDEVLVFPSLCHGCMGCMLACPEGAISETKHELGEIKEGSSGNIKVLYGELKPGEPLGVPLIRKLKDRIKKGITIIDSPPGTACPMVNAVHKTDFCVLVTEPTPFGLHDLKLSVETLSKMEIPYGVVINKYGMGDSKVEDFCRGRGIPVLLKIDFEKRISELYSRGVPFVDKEPEFRKKMQGLFTKIQSEADRREE